MTALEYYDLIQGFQTFVADNIIKPAVLVADSTISVKKRYITSEGSNLDAWYNALKDANGKVNIFCVSSAMLASRRPPAIKTFSRVFSLTVDYFYGYKIGTDADNTEAKFLKNLVFADFELEKYQSGGLPRNAYISRHSFRLGIKRFETNSAHFAVGDLEITIPVIQM